MPDDLPHTGGHVRLGSNSGQPMTRRDGIAKVTGAATYAADNLPEGGLTAVCADAGIARGRVTRLDTAAALAHPGVLHVMTPANRPPLAQDPTEKPASFSRVIDVLQDDRVRYARQPVALVVAETLEAATEGARLLAPDYEAEPARIGFEAGEVYSAGKVGVAGAPRAEVGDLAAGWAAAAHRVETEAETPLQYHNAMEAHAVVAEWEGDRVTVHTPSQAISSTAGLIARWFGIPAENVTLLSPYLGGGFGSKAFLAGPQILGILAARHMGRPVKLVLRREQMFGPVQSRGATRQRVALGLSAEGRLTALEHHTQAATSSYDEFLEGASGASLNTYAAPAILGTHEGVRMDIGTPGPMRAPGEASGSAALEIAMDRAAEALGLDPLELRLRNYAETDPASGRPFSSKALRECYARGAEAIGWADRPRAPRQRRDARGHLVGLGMGTALFPVPHFMAEARAVIRRDGTATVATSAADMGQGAWTALAQIAADGLGLQADRVVLESGTSDLPNAGTAGGSAHTASAGSALFSAGADAVRQLADIATADPDSPLFGAGNAGVRAEDGWLRRADDPGRGEPFADILARAAIDSVTGTGKSAREKAAGETYAMFGHGAVFAEVKVDPDLGQVRVSRLVGAFAAGRIINPRLARSQLTGGMIWGLGFALHEEGLHDRRTGRPVNGDLAGYHVPVNADVPEVEALMVHEDDPHVNSLGVKGVGEIGITGTVGAIANAVWHATGYRPRRFPIHPVDLIG